jgi:general secretion pathway protein D
MGKMTMVVTCFSVLFCMTGLCLAPPVIYGQQAGSREAIVMKVIRLDHADAEQLASVLRPLLSRDGLITAYTPTNTLIIRDRASLVEKLVKVIKGPSSDSNN